MRLDEFASRVTSRIARKQTDPFERRVWVHYRDLLNLHEIVLSIAKEFPVGDILALRDPNRQAEFQQWKRSQDLSESLLKAMHVFGDIVQTVTLHETSGRPPTETTINKCLDAKDPILVVLKPDVLVRAYALSNYRNKLVVHHNYERMNARKSSKGEVRLAPLTADAALLALHEPEIRTIAKKYEPHVPSLVGETNSYLLLHGLFYKTPPLIAGKYNKADRDRINELAEICGVESLSPQEIVETVDNFCLEVVDEFLKLP